VDLELFCIMLLYIINNNVAYYYCYAKKKQKIMMELLTRYLYGRSHVLFVQLYGEAYSEYN